MTRAEQIVAAKQILDLNPEWKERRSQAFDFVLAHERGSEVTLNFDAQSWMVWDAPQGVLRGEDRKVIRFPSPADAIRALGMEIRESDDA